MTTVTALGALAVFLWITSIWVTRYNHHHTPGIDNEPLTELAADDLPSVLVVVPVRDEERNIRACLEALSRSHYASMHIRVVDDGSTDRTAEIVGEVAACDPRIRLMTAGDLPHGWLGKNHALWVGTRDAQEDWVLFLDADIRIEPACVGRAIRAATRLNADLLTVIPKNCLVTFWDSAVQAVVAHFLTICGDAASIKRPDTPIAAAIGPFMLFRRAAYEQIGGHERVRAEVVEDLRLAEAIKRDGKRLVLARGTRIASIHMYESLGAMVNGWTKNFHVGLQGRLWLAPFAAIVLVFFYCAPFVLPVVGLACADAVGAAMGFVAATAVLVARNDFERLYDVSARRSYLAPLGVAVVAWILIRSSVRAALGRASYWKGRPVSPIPRPEVS